MIFKRIGTDKHLYKVNFYLKKLKGYAPRQQQYIKVCLIKGSQKYEMQKPVKIKKQTVNFNKEKLSFTCTMFYDPKQKKYLEKPLKLRLIQTDTDCIQMSTVATIEFDLADYANQSEKYLEIEFEFQDLKANLNADIELILLNNEGQVKQDDKDSAKSQTFSIASNKEDKKPEFKKNKLNLIKQESEKNSQSKKKAEKEKNVTDISAQSKKKSEKQEKNLTDFNEFSLFKNNMNEENVKQKNKLDQLEKGPSIRVRQQPKTIKATAQEIKQNKIDNVRVFLLEKQVEQNLKQIEYLKNENQTLKESLKQFLGRPKQSVYQSSLAKFEKLQKENQSLKSDLIKTKIQLNESEIRFKGFKQRQKKSEQIIESKSKEIQNLERQLESIKFNIAELLQRCFELDDPNLIALVQEHFKME